MRCPSCEKFVSYDTEVEPEEQDEPTFEDGVFRASYRRVLSCAECGEELKDAEIEVEIDAEIDEPAKEQKPEDELCDTCGARKEDCQGQNDDAEPHDFKGNGEYESDEDAHDHEWNVFAEASPSERTQTHDRHGKPIKNYRYMRRYYGVSVEFSAECDCGATAAATGEGEEQASGFNELV